MVTSLARAFRWQALIDEGVYSNVQELARAIGKDMAYVSRITRLTLLSPKIIHGVLTGSWPKSAWKSASRRSRFYGMNRKSFSASSNAPQLILPPFLCFGWKQYNFFDFSFDFQILSVILWLVNNN